MSKVANEVVVTGVGLAVPGLTGADDLLSTVRGGGFDPATSLLGRELRHKDRASRLALRAVEPALRDAGLLDETGFRGSAEHTAVVVSSNLGNLDSVCEFTDTIATETVTALSPMGLPHTSSNVVAGWIAIHYGLRGPNVTVCNGATGGLDAMYWARNLIAVGRARVAVVVGVEPANDVVAKLLGDDSVDGAVAVVLESVENAAAHRARPRATVAEYARGTDLTAAVATVLRKITRPVGLWLTAERAAHSSTDGFDGLKISTRVDLAAWLGPCSGALGVLQCAAGVAYLYHDTKAVLATTGGGPDDEAAAALLLTTT
jgi:3-oxoacyl-[acyl-carrier-protein] synthase II